MNLRIVHTTEDLLPHVAAWNDLASQAVEPNPFYESWMLLPALRYFAAGKDLRFLLFFESAEPSARLCGFVPLERQTKFLGLPLRAWSLWKYNHCGLTTPLLRAHFARQCVAELFEWLHSKDGDCSMFELRTISGEGQFHQLLAEHLSADSTIPLIWEWYTRAFFLPQQDADTYLSTALTGKQRSELRRKARLLTDQGTVELSTLTAGDEVESWIQSFLRIEGSGWKGREGSALVSNENHRNFFTEAVTSAFLDRRLVMLAMSLNGEKIAQNTLFVAGRGCFYFKQGYDEQYAKGAPGFSLDCETVRYLHSRKDIDWMDTCTSRHNELSNRLFVGRKTVQTLLVPVGSRGSQRLVISAIPFLRSLKHTAGSLLAANASAPHQL